MLAVHRTGDPTTATPTGMTAPGRAEQTLPATSPKVLGRLMDGWGWALLPDARGVSRAPWMICRGESRWVIQKPHITPCQALQTLTPCTHKAYAELSEGVLCSDFATQRC
jgi:hypothetical protein